MSIIERALEKNRGAKAAESRRDGKSRADGVLVRADQAAAIDPRLRIKPVTAMLDQRLCRERRVLMQQSDEGGDDSGVAAYRMLRTRLLHRARTKKWVTIGVTSAGPNDGKTLTSVNLAFSLAREKSREIVLLDMDMRKPNVFRTLGLDTRRELRDYLERGGDTQGMFISVGNDNLLIAGSSTPTDQASELLSSPRFEELLRDLKQGAVDPIILIDLPPVLVTDDALVVAPKVDAFLVVVSEGLTSRSDLAKAMNLLSEFPVAGVVLNRAVETAPGYGYGYEYSSKGPVDKDPVRN